MPQAKTVFLSGVTNEMGKLRSRLALELRRHGLHVVVQDDFRQGRGRRLLEKLKRRIDKCDAVICLIGRAYGEEPLKSGEDLATRRSYTQWEFYYALERNRKEGTPLLLFLANDESEVEPIVQSEEEAHL